MLENCWRYKMSENRIHHEETIKSETIYDGRIIKVRVDTVELSNMSYSKREIVEHQRAVSLVAITENQEIYLVKQYRKAVDKVIYEIPAGLVDGNESLQDAAKREAQEEIGMKPNNLELLVESYSSPGFTDEIFSVFLATDLEESKLDQDDDEYVEPVLVPLKDALEMVENFEIMDAKTIIGILYAARKYGL